MGETSTELVRQGARKLLHQGLAVLCTLSALLLVLDDQTADLVVGQHLQDIDAALSGATRGGDERADLRQQVADGSGQVSHQVGFFPAP